MHSKLAVHKDCFSLKDSLGNSGSENCSETGLNCPLSRGGGSNGDRDRGDNEDLLQPQGRSLGMGQSQLGPSSHHGALHALAHASQSHIRRGNDRDDNISGTESDEQINGDMRELGGNVDDVVGGTIKRKTQVR